VLQSWEDLLPSAVATSDDPYARLSEAQLRRLARCVRARWLVDTGRDSEEGASAREITGIRRTFAEEGEDVDWLLSQREKVREHRIRNSYNPAVVGKRVTLAGLVLPLEWDGRQQFNRFLLAPDLGKCSHEAPPIHNQVTYVEAPKRIGIVPVDGLEIAGDPCFRVEGILRFAASSHNAFRVDGLMRVDASYAIEVTAILPASPAEIGAFHPPERSSRDVHEGTAA